MDSADAADFDNWKMTRKDHILSSLVGAQLSGDQDPTLKTPFGSYKVLGPGVFFPVSVRKKSPLPAPLGKALYRIEELFMIHRL